MVNKHLTIVMRLLLL